jgi:hypothetical protein
MTMVVTDDFVGFQIPAFHHFVLCSGKKIGMSTRDTKPSHSRYVSSQGQLQLSRGKIPDLSERLSLSIRSILYPFRNSL